MNRTHVIMIVTSLDFKTCLQEDERKTRGCLDRVLVWVINILKKMINWTEATI